MLLYMQMSRQQQRVESTPPTGSGQPLAAVSLTQTPAVECKCLLFVEPNGMAR